MALNVTNQLEYCSFIYFCKYCYKYSCPTLERLKSHVEIDHDEIVDTFSKDNLQYCKKIYCVSCDTHFPIKNSFRPY